MHCKLWLQNKPPQTQGLETSRIFILLTDLQLRQGLRGAHLCSRGVSRRTFQARAGIVITCAGKVTGGGALRGLLGPSQHFGPVPEGLPFQGWVSNDIHRGLCNSFGENDQNSNYYSVHYILSLKKSFFPLYLVKHVYFLKI